MRLLETETKKRFDVLKSLWLQLIFSNRLVAIIAATYMGAMDRRERKREMRFDRKIHEAWRILPFRIVDSIIFLQSGNPLV